MVVKSKSWKEIKMQYHKKEKGDWMNKSNTDIKIFAKSISLILLICTAYTNAASQASCVESIGIVKISKNGGYIGRKPMLSMKKMLEKNCEVIKLEYTQYSPSMPANMAKTVTVAEFDSHTNIFKETYLTTRVKNVYKGVTREKMRHYLKSNPSDWMSLDGFEGITNALINY